MKKILVLVLALVMALSVVALVACDAGETVEGEYKYAYNDTLTYGVKVKVTVKDGVITACEVTSTDPETYTNLSANWTTNYQPGGPDTEGRKAWLDKHDEMVTSFVGQKVEDINKIKVACDTETNAEAHTVKGQPKAGGITGAPSALVVTGATQSSGRLILAVQNALSQLTK